MEAEIIPRLLLAHGGPGGGLARVGVGPSRIGKVGSGGAANIAPSEVESFASLPLALEADELLAVTEAFLDRGVSVEAVLVDLLAPSARALGRYWEEDLADFVEVTMGLWRLQEVTRRIAAGSPARARLHEPKPTALFSPMPGEQHSFGALMVEQVFDRAGWRTSVLLEPLHCELMAAVAAQSYDLVGLTVSCDCEGPALRDLVADIRNASQYGATQILVGGRVVNDRPDLAEASGADGTAADARSALALAERKVNGAKVVSQQI